MEEIKVNIDGKEQVVKIEEEGNSLKVHLDGKVYTVETGLKNEQKDFDLEESSDSSAGGSIRAHLPGVIFSIDIKQGDKVKKGQKLCSLVAMKMENQIKAPIAGKIKKINVKKNDKVNKGDILLIIE
ncbi:biotin/lipoyl-binding protein [Candidatus Woesearchaeota archaeon]|nr:biotin/lipoyl-binding protein [Candidatus Woesearchaeota archaeon]